MKITPTTTVPNKLLVKIAIANAGIAANSLRILAEREISFSDNNRSCANNAAITATGTCFNQRIAHLGNSN